jgi:hypothetical protein
MLSDGRVVLPDWDCQPDWADCLDGGAITKGSYVAGVEVYDFWDGVLLLRADGVIEALAYSSAADAGAAPGWSEFAARLAQRRYLAFARNEYSLVVARDDGTIDLFTIGAAAAPRSIPRAPGGLAYVRLEIGGDGLMAIRSDGNIDVGRVPQDRASYEINYDPAKQEPLPKVPKLAANHVFTAAWRAGKKWFFGTAKLPRGFRVPVGIVSVKAPAYVTCGQDWRVTLRVVSGAKTEGLPVVVKLDTARNGNREPRLLARGRVGANGKAVLTVHTSWMECPDSLDVVFKTRAKGHAGPSSVFRWSFGIRSARWGG